MSIETLIAEQVVQPMTDAVGASAVPAGLDCAVILYVSTTDVCPTTPMTMRALQSFEDAPDLWLEIGRVTSLQQPNSAAYRVVRPDPLARHVRVVASGHRGRAVVVRSFAVIG